jgi:hypothetical protein
LSEAFTLVDGKRLARLLLDRPAVFDDDVCSAAGQIGRESIPLPYVWEPPTCRHSLAGTSSLDRLTAIHAAAFAPKK